MGKHYKELKPESQKLLEAAYELHFGVLQTCEVGKKYIIKIRDRKIVKLAIDDIQSRKAYELAFEELLENSYIQPHLDTYKVSEMGYLCVQNR